MQSATLEGYVFKPGDIVYTGGRCPSFYKVTKRTKCYVTIQQIESSMTQDDGYGQNGRERPLNITYRYPSGKIAPEIRVKILSDTEYHPGEYGKIDGKWYACLYPYNGEPIRFWSD